MEDEIACFDFTRVVKSTDIQSSEKNINYHSSKTIVNNHVQEQMTGIEFQKNSLKSFHRSNTMILTGALTQKTSQSVITAQQQFSKNFSNTVKTTVNSPKANPIHKAQSPKIPKIPKLHLKGDGRKSGLIMFNIARFQQMIVSKIDTKTYCEF